MPVSQVGGCCLPVSQVVQWALPEGGGSGGAQVLQLLADLEGLGQEVVRWEAERKVVVRRWCSCWRT